MLAANPPAVIPLCRQSMKSFSTLFSFAFLLCLLSSCQPEAGKGESDIEVIKAANSYYISLHPKGDVDALMDLYTPGAVILSPYETVTEGKEAIRRSWDTWFEAVVVEDASSTMDEVIVFGDWAYARGHFSDVYIMRSDSSRHASEGRFSGLWKRSSNGDWKIARDTWFRTGNQE